MSKTITISDKLYENIVGLSVKQTAPEKSSDEFFNAMEYYGQYDDAYDGGVEDGEIGLAKQILQNAKDEAERK